VELHVVSVSYVLFQWATCCFSELRVVSVSYMLFQWATCCFSELRVVSVSNMLFRWATCCFSELPVVSVSYVLFQWASTLKFQLSLLVYYKTDIIIICLVQLVLIRINWYIDHVVWNNNHSFPFLSQNTCITEQNLNVLFRYLVLIWNLDLYNFENIYTHNQSYTLLIWYFRACGSYLSC
jgi:hypothetical protein